MVQIVLHSFGGKIFIAQGRGCRYAHVIDKGDEWLVLEILANTWKIGNYGDVVLLKYFFGPIPETMSIWGEWN